jgi:hypothetical protein
MIDKKKSRSKKSRSALRNLNFSLNLPFDNMKKSNFYFYTKKLFIEKSAKDAKHNNTTSKKETKIDLNDEILNNMKLEDITYKEIDGKIDPKEPVYCFCNYISYGNMVKCDNSKVNYEFIFL